MAVLAATATPAAAQARVAVVGRDQDAVLALRDELGGHREIDVVEVTAPGIDSAAAATALAVRWKLNAVVTVAIAGDDAKAVATVVAYEGLDGFVLGKFEAKAPADKLAAWWP